MTRWLRLLPFPLVGLALVAARPDVFPPKDFPEYWASAVVFANGGDPYDGAQLLPVQRTVMGEHIHQATSLWTPPWTLPLYLPLGFLPFTVARFVWIGLQLAMVFAAVELLWRSYSSRDQLWLLPHLLALLFAPMFWLALFGQNTAFLLLGLAGFLHFRDTRPYLAGCFAALTAVKPHLLAVFGVLLVLDASRRDGWKVLLAGGGTLAVLSLVSLAVNRDIFDLFVAAVRRPATPETVPLSEWDLPLIAHKLRHAIDPHRFWIQFVPLGVACGMMAVHKLWLGRRWEWREQLPWAVLVSCLYAPYGGWMFDLVVLLVPVVAAASGLVGDKAHVRPSVGLGETFTLWPATVLLGYLVVSLMGFLIPSLQEPMWFTPAVAALFVCGRVCRGRGKPDRSPESPASSAICTGRAVS
jgi:hypothetical protein